jgi:WD40 repeat protein/tetratricopeptide (TPR) repeat protein
MNSTFIRTFILLVFLGLSLSTSLAQTKKPIRVSPVVITWDAQARAFNADYTIYNDTHKDRELSIIIVFQSENIKWWRGAILPKVKAKSRERFVLSFPAYILLKNNYRGISVKLYGGKNYEPFLDKSATYQDLSSKVVTDDHVKVIFRESIRKQLTDRPETTQPKTLILGKRSELRSLLISSLGEGARLKRITESSEGRRKEELIAEFKAKQNETRMLLEEIDKLEDEAIDELEEDPSLLENTVLSAVTDDELARELDEPVSKEDIVKIDRDEATAAAVPLSRQGLLIENFLRKKLAVNPTDISVGKKLVRLYLSEKRPAKAFVFLKNQLKLNPDNLDVSLTLSKVYKKTGNILKAIKVLTFSLSRIAISAKASISHEIRAVVQKGKSTLTKLSDGAYLAIEYGKWGQAFLDHGQYKKALTTFVKIKSLIPDYPLIDYYEGLSHKGLNQYSQAVASFWQQDEKTPDMTRNLLAASETLLLTEDLISTKKAIKKLEVKKKNEQDTDQLEQIKRYIIALKKRLPQKPKLTKKRFQALLRGADKPRLVVNSEGHVGSISSFHFAGGNNKVATTGRDKTINIWNIKSRKVTMAIRGQIDSGDMGVIHKSAISPDKKRLAVSGIFAKHHMVRIIDMETGLQSHLLEYKSGNRNVTRLQFSADGRYLASGGYGQYLYIWDIDGEKIIAKLKSKEKSSVSCMGFSTDLKRMVSGDYKGMLTVWDIEEQKVIRRHSTNEKKIVAAVFHNDDKAILYSTQKGTVGLLSLEDDNTQPKTALTLTKGIRSMHVSKDGTKALIGLGRKGYRAIGIPGGEILHSNDTLYGSGLKASQDWTLIGVSSRDKINLYNLQSGKHYAVLKGKGNYVRKIGYARDGKSIAWGYRKKLQHALLFGDPDSPGISISKETPNGNDYLYEIKSVGDYSLERNKKQKLEILRKGKKLNIKPFGWQAGSTFTPDGQTIIRGFGWSYLQSLDLSGKRVHSFSGHFAEVWYLAPSPDNQRFVSSALDQTIRIWHLKSGKHLATLFYAADKEWVLWVPDGYYAASQHGHKYIGWHINQGQEKNALYYPASTLAEMFYRPEVVARYINGEGDIEKALEQSE